MLHLEQLCSSIETCCLNNHTFSFNAHLHQQGDHTLSPFKVMVFSRADICKKIGRNLAHKVNDDVFDKSSHLPVSFIPVSPYPSAQSQQPKPKPAIES